MATMSRSQPEPQPMPSGDVPPAKRDGFPAATLMAAGVGVFVLGLMTTWAEASASMKSRLQLNDDVGPLSGKTTWAVIAFAASWVVLSVVLWKRDKCLNIALGVFAVLTVAGLVGTFPTFFQAFG